MASSSNDAAAVEASTLADVAAAAAFSSSNAAAVEASVCASIVSFAWMRVGCVDRR